MCGICGQVSFSGEKVELEKLKRMNLALVHRGPDGEGYWRDKEEKVGFAHRRLSIIDLSERGHQPMHYSNRFTITFNGEIYNYLELKEELIKEGYKFKSETDTEVLLTLYAKHGSKCLEKLDGMFAFAIWDDLKKECFLARDRFGEKPLYYFKNENKLVFASEIKALKAYGINPIPDSQAIFNYLQYFLPKASNDQESTFYENIKSLRPGSYKIVSLANQITTNTYYNLKSKLSNHSNLDLEEASFLFFEKLKASIDLRLRSDVAVGSSLSGGLDSSSIIAVILDYLEVNSFSTFSACFPGFEKDEEKYIDILKAKYQSNATFCKVYPTEESMADNYLKIIESQDEPFGSMTINSQYEVYKLAKEKGVTVLLDGQGADEYLAGYSRFQDTYYYQLKSSKAAILNSELAAYQKLYHNKYNFRNKELRIKTSFPKAHSLLAELKKRSKAKKDPYFNGISTELVKQNRSKENPIPSAATLKEDLMQSLTVQGLNQLLRYSDRNSMMNSVEVRLPFLDHKLVEFALSLPNEYLIGRGWRKYLLRNSMNQKLPDSITWRKTKFGFATPQSKFLNSSFFSNRVEEARNFLLKEGFIDSKYSELNWNYVMLYEYMNN